MFLSPPTPLLSKHDEKMSLGENKKINKNVTKFRESFEYYMFSQEIGKKNYLVL